MQALAVLLLLIISACGSLTLEFYLFTYLFIYFYGDKVLCSLARLPAHSVEEGDLELLILSGSASQVLHTGVCHHPG